jgi:4-amino-4-deoxy-L-arabinose transferase-like glycosyltransferase
MSESLKMPDDEPEPAAPPSDPEGAAAPDAEAEVEKPLLTPGNTLRLARGSVAIAVGVLGAFALMAVRAQLRFGVPLGALAIFVATFGALDLAGSFDDGEERIAGRATLAELARPLLIFFGGAFGLWALIALAVAGRLDLPGIHHPVLVAGVLVPAAFLAVIVGAYQVGDVLSVWEKMPDGSPRPLLQRHGFWLVAGMVVVYLPVLGSHSLSDPWETHYGEVAREILSRNDWISLWWAQDGWFWSKPILDFWIQALAMATFGVRWQPDGMLSAMREGHVPWPEWAVRLPVFLLTLLAVYLLYKAVARVFGRRAGLLGGVVLITMPQWFLVTHQTMTDMPFVAPMAAAMAMILLGAHTDPDEEVNLYEVAVGKARLRLSLYHLVVGAVVACALPQILYLASRNVELGLSGVHFHVDAFMAGSPGNCGLPSNESCHGATPVLRGLHPSLQALIWAQALGLILYMNWGERRRQRLYYLAAWLFAALSTMAKGPAGFILPILCALAYIVVSRRWRELLNLEIASGTLILFAVAMPWFVAMYARHGQPFTDRLLFHDMFKRAFTHVHDTNEGDDTSFRFYVWQLGYAMFPWTGLVPAGLLYWLRRREDGRREGDASVFLVMWFLFAFALFSLMLTKFHHYILPAVPPAAMLTGILLDGMLARAETRTARPYSETAIQALGVGGGTLLGLYGISRVITVSRTPIPASRSAIGELLASVIMARVLVGTGLLLAVGAAFYAHRQSRARLAALGLGSEAESEGALAGHAYRKSAARFEGLGSESESESESAEPFADQDDEPRSEETGSLQARFNRVQLGAVGIAGAILVLFVGRDLSANFEGAPSQIRLLHLFTYNYRRGWPASLDFTATLWAFTITAAILTALLAWASARRHVVSALLAVGLGFAVWGLDSYFMKTSPHWGQRETVLAYYEQSNEVPGPLIAYQMNWKGENFYTGNHVPAFVSSGKKFQDYVTDERKKGTKTFYFMSEQARTGTLQNEIGATTSFEKLTPPELNNKFLLVRATFGELDQPRTP